MKTEFSLRSCN